MNQNQNENNASAAGNEAQQNEASSLSPIRKIIGIVVAVAVLIGGGYYGYQQVLFYQNHVETEDAHTDGNISPVLPRVTGYVTDVYVEDNEYVEKGDLLVSIDSTEYALKAHMAEAALKNASAAKDVAQANLESAKVALHKAQIDYNRVHDLYEGGAATKSQMDDVETGLQSAKAQVEIAQQRLTEVKSRIEAKKDDLKYARLQLSYTQITAPNAGLVSKKDVETGQLIQPGQPLMAVTDTKEVWVVANYKETELSNIRVGQDVDIDIDAYPEKTFHGRVESIAGATGSKYALLPPENATGNFVKVVQRVPVKIVFTEKQDPRYPIRLGLNVTATINLDHTAPGTVTDATASR
jgi:membrane fusion protein (multidrug efflux system)